MSIATLALVAAPAPGQPLYTPTQMVRQGTEVMHGDRTNYAQLEPGDSPQHDRFVPDADLGVAATPDFIGSAVVRNSLLGVSTGEFAAVNTPRVSGSPSMEDATMTEAFPDADALAHAPTNSPSEQAAGYTGQHRAQ